MERIFKLILWATEGYYVEYRRRNESIELNSLIKEYKEWLKMFKKMSYKEEYL